MYTVELYARVRRAVLVEGRSQRAVAGEFGLARKTVRKMLEYSAPPGYQRRKPIRRPKLGPGQGVIEAILEEGDPTLIAAGLGEIAKAIGVSEFARQTGISREAIYKGFAPGGNPTLETLTKATQALGLRLTVKPAA